MKNKSAFIRLVKDIKKYYGYLIVAVFGMLIVAASQLVSPLVTRKLVALITGNDANIAEKALRMGIFLLIIYALQAVGQFARNYFAHIAAWRYASDMRIKLYNHIQNMSMGFFADKQTGQLMSRITSDTTNLEPFIAHALPDIIVNGIVFIGSTIVIFVINARLALVSMCAVPITCVLVYIYATKFRPRFKIAHEKIGELNAVLQDELSGEREITAFNRQKHESEKVGKASVTHADAILSALKGSAIFNPVILFTSNIGLVIVIIVGGGMAGKLQITAADIVAFLMYVSYFYQPITGLTKIFEDINNALAAADRSFEILDTENNIVGGDFKPAPKSIKGKIEFRNVEFAYNDNNDVFRNLSFTVPAGKSLALVGPTGIGKTTIASLIARFYDVNDGEILIDDVNVKDYDLGALRDQMSMVLQDVFLFHGSVADNIAFGKVGATREEIEEAGRLANTDEFVLATENGYDTLVGERGMRLSGGQKQRISIARAILRDMPILILDEATAAVDTKTERLIQEALDRLSKNRTTIVIAHRLSTVRNCDIIAVLGETGIEEMGTHDELVALKGKYWELLEQK